MDSKFALYNYAGNPTAYYIVQHQPVDPAQITTAQQVSHHIMVVDRSGSMYSEMEPLKAMLLKLLTLEEYADTEMLTTLISYSSQGDVTTHFSRKRVGDVMRANSAEQEEIKRLHVTGLTCISQGLAEARKYVQGDEVTAITLHSDGYANDRSPTAEGRELDKIAAEIAKQANVFVNTIAYSPWSDFKLLSRVANAASGVCVHAVESRQVYDALHNTSDLLAGQVTPALEAPIGDASYQVFFSSSAMKLNGSSHTMVVRGLKPEDDKVLYRYFRVSKDRYDATQAPVAGEAGPESLRPLLAFGKANLAEGALNTAKYALVASRDATMLGQHARALTNQEIVNFSSGLEQALFMDELGGHEFVDQFGLKVDKISVLELLGLLREHASDVKLDLKDLASIYVRRSLKRVPGTRDEAGNLVSPWLKTEYVDEGPYAQVQGFDINRNSATINMLVTRKVRLVKTEDGTPITTVAGVDVSTLTSYNNYTIVGDGSLNVSRLKIKVGSKKLFRALEAVGMVSGEFDPASDYVLNLSELPLISFSQKFADVDGLFPTLLRFKVLSSILTASLKEQSDTYTAEQLEELKRHYLSGALYLNFPTTNEYTDLKEALATGKVDTRVSYKIDLGDPKILNLSKLHSANKFLDRLFVMSIDGKESDKPTFDQLFDGKLSFTHKKLSARTKLTAVDDAMRPLFEDFLGLANNGALAQVLAEADASEYLDKLKGVCTGATSKDDAVEAMAAVRRKVDAKQNQLFREKISPLVFYIGATGLLPDEFDTKAMTADELTGKFPDAAVAKAEQEGTFFLIGNTILSVYIESEYFTPKPAPATTADP
jgi:hypothetical protein